MFERFTDRARRVLVLAQEESRLLNHSFIGTEHLLLGLIHEGEGVAAKALEQLGVQLEDVREKVEERVGLFATAPTGSPPFTPRAKKVLELALREAHQMGHLYIGTEHILLGIVREGEGVGAQVLASLGADPARVRQKVIQLLSGASGTTEEVGGVVAPLRSPRSQGGGVFSAPGAKVVACSFCGRQPPETGEVIAGTDAYICEHCIREWAIQLGQSFVTSEPSRAAYIYRPGRPIGALPADEAAAKSEIEAAFAGLGTVSDDGESVPVVEGGENLGPSLAAAKARSVPEGAALSVSLDEVAFVDAEHATVTISISVDGRRLLSWSREEALVVDGIWKVARKSFCHLMELAGVECPPPASK